MWRMAAMAHERRDDAMKKFKRCLQKRPASGSDIDDADAADSLEMLFRLICSHLVDDTQVWN